MRILAANNNPRTIKIGGKQGLYGTGTDTTYQGYLASSSIAVTNLTIEFFFVTSSVDIFFEFLSDGSFGSGFFDLQLLDDHGSLIAKLSIGGDYLEVPIANFNVINHIAFQLDNSSGIINCYLNGTLIGSVLSGVFTAFHDLLFLLNPYDGNIIKMRKLRISNVIRYTNSFIPLDDDIVDDANTVAFYPLEDKNPNQLTDIKGNLTIPLDGPPPFEYGVFKVS
jgi:hypothetical protein